PASVLVCRRASCPSARKSAPASRPRSQQRDGNEVAAAQILAGALAAAGRGRRRGDDVLDAELRTGAAVVAGCPPTVLHAGGSQGVLPVVPQEVLVEPGADVGPREQLVTAALAVHVPVDGESVPGHGVLPHGQVELLAP